jgi:thiol-disulfide isomerase/thioredoxin
MILIVVNCFVAAGVYVMIHSNLEASSLQGSGVSNPTHSSSTVSVRTSSDSLSRYSSATSIYNSPSTSTTTAVTTSETHSFIPTCSPSIDNQNSSSQEGLNLPISPIIYSELSGVSCATLSSIGEPSYVYAPTAINGSMLISNGKPEILYVGAEFCPFCAAERWSLIVALSKFGTFSGLEYMLSSSTDIYPNTPTFTFLNASYSSPYVSLATVEIMDRNRNPLQTMTSSEQALFNEYDKTESIPFIDISNQFVIATSQYTPSVLSGEGWDQVAAQLNNASNNYALNIDGSANSIIRDICAVDGNNPGTICNQSFVKNYGSLFWVALSTLYFETIVSIGVMISLISTNKLAFPIFLGKSQNHSLVRLCPFLPHMDLIF